MGCCSRMYRLGLSVGMDAGVTALVLGLAVCGPEMLAAQGPGVSGAQAELAAADATGPVSLQGVVTDPDGAVIPGAVVTLTPTAGQAYVIDSGADGAYAFRGVKPGAYSLTVSMAGFGPFVRLGVKVGGAAALNINAKLAVQDQTTVVNVTTDGNRVAVDQDSNASKTVLTGKDLDALADDPDELSAELSALAGPAAGPNGGQIYIDGFTGGELPPKSSIREIRVNQNPFSAEYDRVGFGRVEIFTKPGTDTFHGSGQINGNTGGFNTGSPFIGAGIYQPPYHTVFGFGSLTGPLNKRASFTLSGSLRKIQNNTVVLAPAIYATSQTSGALCFPGAPGCAVYSNFNFVNFAPQTRWDITPRVDVALSEKNTLMVRFQYERNSARNENVGGLDLFSTGYDSSQTESEIQVSDTQVLSAKVINESRMEFRRRASTTTPGSTLATIDVQGAFTGGGNGGGAQADTQNYLELQNYTSVATAKHFVRLGGRLRTTGETNTTAAGQNGTFTYNSIADYQSGLLADYTQTKISVPTISARATDLGLYAEDDWKVRPNFTFSYGLRYETQNFIHDHADFAPRLSAAYGLGKTTVLRAGAGFFYDRFGLGNEFNVYRNGNVLNQQQYTLSASPGAPLDPACSPGNQNACLLGAGVGTARLTTRTISDRLRAPYSVQANFGLDQQLFKGATMSVNYQHIRGLHQYNSDVVPYQGVQPIGTPVGGQPGGGTSTPLVFQYQSEGVFNQNQVVTNVNYRGFHNSSFFGYYVLNFAHSDSSGPNSFPSIPGNLGADYGRASFDVRHRAFLGGSFTLPYLITLSPLVVAASGKPYDITSGLDVFHDNHFNGRAVFASSASQPGIPGGYVKTIAGCGTFATPGAGGNNTPVPVNYCTGPASFTLNLRVVKTIGFGEMKRPEAETKVSAPKPGTVSLGSPGGHGPRGPRGLGGGTATAHRYNLSIGAQVQNVFNVADRNVPNGTLTSPSFGVSTQLAGNIFTTDSAVRRVVLQLAFAF